MHKQLLLRKQYHGIARHVVSVQPANDQSIQSEPKRILLKASAQLQDLDDECLMKIIKHLDAFGLCAAAKICVRFKRLAEQVFLHSKKYDKIALEKFIFNMRNTDYAANETLFRTFSHLIRKHKIAFWYDELEYFSKYPCDHLTHLELSFHACCVIHKNTNDKLKLIFSRLHHLGFASNGELDSNTINELLSSCSELKSITIYSNGKYMIHFPKLQKVEMVDFNKVNFEIFLVV